MLLTIDIGNTTINNGIFEGMLIRKRFRIPTYARDLGPQYVKNLAGMLKKIDSAIVVSVVPKVLKKLEPLLEKLVGRELLVVGRDVDSGVKNRYKNPKEVGQDRLVNAKAAFEIYGGGCIIVDFGTAITIDFVNKKREYLGGVIAPGIEISVNALSESASLLPKVTLKKPKSLLAKETAQSMIAGAVFGFSSLCDGVVLRFKKRHCKNSRVIATGGLSTFLGPYCETVDKIDADLTLKGLQVIFQTRKP